MKLVGDRFALTDRQRQAVRRCACSDAALVARSSSTTWPSALAGQTLLIDGYNVLTTAEAALAGGAVIVGRDGCYRDIASMHGTFRKVAETRPAIELVAGTLASLNVTDVAWYLDRPVSNSGRLKIMLAEVAEECRRSWQIELVNNPDAVLVERAGGGAKASAVAATADSGVLDAGVRWFNLAREIVDAHIPDAWIIDLRGGSLATD